MRDQPSLAETIESAFEENGVKDDEPRIVMGSSDDEGRDQSGRFKSKEAPKEETPVKVETPEAKVDTKISQEAKPEEVKGQQEPTFEAPATWRNEAKAQWDKIPLPVRAEIAKRERENLSALNEANNKLASREKEGTDLDKVLSPYAQDWGQRGVSTPQAVAQILARTKAAYANPAKFIREFATETGVDLNSTQEQEVQDPELASLRAQVAKFENFTQTFEQRQQMERQQQVDQTITGFANTKDEAGSPKYPYFNQVQQLMTNLMPNIHATSPNLNHTEKLAKAYDMACRADPEIWGQMKGDMFVKSKQEQVQKDVQIANVAKSRAVSPSSGSGASGGLGVTPSLQDSIRQAYESQMGGNRI